MEDKIFTTGGINENVVIISHSLVLNYLVYILQNLDFQSDLLYLFEHGMGCILHKEHGKTLFRMIELRKFYENNEEETI